MGPQAAAKNDDKITSQMTLSERADHLEEQMMHDLERVVTKSVLANLMDGRVEMSGGAALQSKYPGKYFNMGEDPRLPKMPDKPTLLDYFKCRFASTNHLLQSGALALKAGHSEKVVLACLLHDIAVVSFIRCDHGYWGAQMIAPYVDEEVSEAIRMHQALRFFPDESMGYKYPDMYLKYFGPDYKPEPYIVEEYKRARDSKYYETSRLICVNDVYAFDPNAQVNLEAFEDIIGRNFKQPKEGLGWDNSPSAHMWRTIMWPTRFL
ncbi:MAG: HD domain-containing protein [Xanthobacteraceae bacterium]|nr:HD domain-containing protein [Xanthobacteraceae bacterium]